MVCPQSFLMRIYFLSKRRETVLKLHHPSAQHCVHSTGIWTPVPLRGHQKCKWIGFHECKLHKYTKVVSLQDESPLPVLLIVSHQLEVAVRIHVLG